ncbi:MAG: alpha/beta fold hydrolase [Candidatus Acidiferrales bacterium]
MVEMKTSESAHRSVSLSGPAGSLEALFWDLSAADGAPRFAAVVCHPHPLFGGTMHNKVVYQAAKTLHRAGLPVLRFNFRGAGLSQGEHDNGRGEQDDVRAALDFLAQQFPGVRLLVAGFSFGAWVGLRVGCEDARVAALAGLGMPVGNVDASYLSSCTKPKLLVSGDRDQFAPKEKLEAIVANLSGQAKKSTDLVLIAGADHFFTGHLNDLDAALSAWVDARLAEK